jgi:hypothetical protein
MECSRNKQADTIATQAFAVQVKCLSMQETKIFETSEKSFPNKVDYNLS